MNDIPKNLDKLMEDAKRSLTEEYFEEAWLELREDGVSARTIAEVYIDLALKKLIAEKGGEEASELISHFKALDDMGFIPGNRTLQ